MKDYLEILEKEFDTRTERNPNYSLRSFAKNIGINAGALSQILSGKRVPSFRIMQKILLELNLDEEEEILFQSSVAKAQEEKNLQRQNPHFKKILTQKSFSQSDVHNIEIEKFKIIADWYHYAIFMAIQKDHFKKDIKKIADQFQIRVSQVSTAIERLKRLDIIAEKEERLFCQELHIDTSHKELTTTAHKKRQRQILEKSIEALENQNIKIRDHATMTMAIDPKKIPEAKKRISDFMDELCDFLESGEKKEVYEFATSLFSLEEKHES